MSLDRLPKRLDIDAPREVWVKQNSGSDLAQTIEAYFAERTVRVPKGNYPLPKIIEVTLADDIHPRIIGAGSEHTILRSSLTKMFDILNAAFPATGYARKILLEGLKFQHNCQNPTDITLDLKEAQADLKNVFCNNTNATPQGIGIDSGTEGNQAPNGTPNIWDITSANFYGKSYKLGLDHLTLIAPMVYGAKDRSFDVESAFATPDAHYANWITILNPNIAIAGQQATVIPFYFRWVGQNVRVLFPDIEGTLKLTNPIFFMEQTAPTTYPVEVYGGSCHTNQTNDVLCNDFRRIKFIGGYRLGYRWRRNVGLRANPITAASFLINPFGTVNTVVASTDYEITEDAYITATNSGNANAAWVLKDYVGGNTILAIGGTIAALHCRAGTVLNAGAFTGTAPTMQAWFM